MPQLLLSTQAKHVMLPFTQIKQHVKSVNSHAIVMGEGEKVVYVFLDPLCKFSRKFMKTVTKNPYMLKKYRYNIFLYEISRLHSSDIIHYIYQSKKTLDELKQIMLENKIPSINSSFEAQTKNIVREINSMAKKIDVNKRPYIIISEIVDAKE